MSEHGKQLDMVIAYNRLTHPKGLDIPHRFNPAVLPGPKGLKICLTCGQMAWYRLHKDLSP